MLLLGESQDIAFGCKARQLIWFGITVVRISSLSLVCNARKLRFGITESRLSWVKTKCAQINQLSETLPNKRDVVKLPNEEAH